MGATWKCNDSWILQKSKFWLLLNSDRFDESSKLYGGKNIPGFLIGDSAFTLHPHAQKPFPEHRGLSDVQKNYNYRICSARRIVENAFGRLKARFRKVYKKCEATTEHFSKIILASCILHNVCEERNDPVSCDWIDNASGTDNNRLCQQSNFESLALPELMFNGLM